jgi:hypothetical protein
VFSVRFGTPAWTANPARGDSEQVPVLKRLHSPPSGSSSDQPSLEFLDEPTLSTDAAESAV